MAEESAKAAAPAVEYPAPFTAALDKLLHTGHPVMYAVKVQTIQQVAGCTVEEAWEIGGCYGYKRILSTEKYKDGVRTDAGRMERRRKCRVPAAPKPKLAQPEGYFEDEADE